MNFQLSKPCFAVWRDDVASFVAVESSKTSTDGETKASMVWHFGPCSAFVGSDWSTAKFLQQVTDLLPAALPVDAAFAAGLFKLV